MFMISGKMFKNITKVMNNVTGIITPLFILVVLFVLRISLCICRGPSSHF
jgi:hypothetical protein